MLKHFPSALKDLLILLNDHNILYALSFGTTTKKDRDDKRPHNANVLD